MTLFPDKNYTLAHSYITNHCFFTAIIMDRRDFLKTLAAAGALVTVKTSGMMDVMASTVPSGSQVPASDNADLAAVMNGEPAEMLEAAMKELGGIGRFIKKGDIQRKISLQDVAFRRYIQELRAYLVNFNEPYEIVYVKSKDAYFLRNI